MKKKIAIEIICSLFIILFVYAAVTKILEFEKFKVQLSQSPMLTAFSNWIAWLIPSIEILIAISLSLPKTRIWGLYASLALMVMFTAYIVAILNFSYYIPCSCGGILERLGWEEHLAFNIIFVLHAISGIVLWNKVSKDESLEMAGTNS
jgi:uncharacterized membrane protein YphA (DoxX/SURF4 family)